MLKNLSKREKYLLIVLAVALVFYCYFRIVLLPILDDIQVSKSNINKYTEEINSQILNKITMQKDKKQLEEFKANIDKSLAALPKEERNPEIAHNIKALSDYCGVSMNSINFGQAVEFKLEQAPKVSDKVMSVPVMLQVSGNYKSIMSFISKIENDSRIALVNTAAINGNDNALQAVISVSYLYTAEQNSKDINYDFNNGVYGKDDLFK